MLLEITGDGRRQASLCVSPSAVFLVALGEPPAATATATVHLPWDTYCLPVLLLCDPCAISSFFYLCVCKPYQVDTYMYMCVWVCVCVCKSICNELASVFMAL